MYTLQPYVLVYGVYKVYSHFSVEPEPAMKNHFSSSPSVVSLSESKPAEIDSDHPLLNKLLVLGYDHEDCVKAISQCGYDLEAAEKYIHSRCTTEDGGQAQSK